MTNEATRNARALLRERMIDPLWRTAHLCGAYRAEDDRAVEAIHRAARMRVYGFLADRLDMAYGDCDVGTFDVETCRRAWRILRGVTYVEIRDWYKLMRPKPQKRADGNRNGVRPGHQSSDRADARRD